MLDFRIQTFLEVCRFHNYSRAAEALHITQPAVSQHMKYLEDLFDVQLINIVGRQVYLTPAGEVLLQKATMLQNDVNFLKDQLKNMEGERVKTCLGVTKTIGEYVIGSSLAKYIKNHPQTRIKVEMANTSELLEQMEQGSIQFALIEGNFPKQNFESLVLKEDDFIPVCGKDYHFHKEPKYIKDLLNEQLLVRESGSGTREILEQNLTAHNMDFAQFQHCFEIQSVHLIVELLKDNVGISFLYRSAVEKELEAGVLREIQLKDFNIKHDFTFLWMKDSLFSAEYERICKELMGEL